MKPLRGRYFDGHSARAREVRLELREDALWILSDEISRSARLAELEISEPTDGAPRILRFRDAASCEAQESAELRALLAALGHSDALVVRWQQRWSVALAAVALLAALGAGGYFVALPRAGDWVARTLPEAAIQELGRHTLRILDHSQFADSELAPERQQALRARFAELRRGREALPEPRVQFRSALHFGPNAFALPGNDIVFTDEIIALAQSDEELVGVFAHELGHLTSRHSLRSLVQGSAVALALSLYLGDVSAIAAGFATFLLEARYSRAFEREADAFAAELLHSKGLSTQPLAELLGRLDAAEPGEQAGENAPDRGPGSYLSTHPHTAERIRALREP